MKVTESVAIDHGLKKEEFAKICELLKRTPNITELGIFSVTSINLSFVINFQRIMNHLHLIGIYQSFFQGGASCLKHFFCY